MGIKDWLGIGSEISKPIKAIGDLYTTDKARIEAEIKLQEVIQKPQLAQIDLNKIFASSSSIFNSGWMPLIGWTSGFLIGLYYAPQIIIQTYVWGVACLAHGYCESFPMKPENIMNLVYLVITGGVHHVVKKKIES